MPVKEVGHQECFAEKKFAAHLKGIIYVQVNYFSLDNNYTDSN